MNPELTYDINHRASVRLARAAKEAGVARFLFSSSCSLYGAAGEAPLTEEAGFNPVTPYGESKILVEQDLVKLADDEFTPVSLRNATVYGASPRLRADLVVNNLVGYAFTTGEVLIKSDGSPWRPLVHVEDVSRAFVALLDAPRDAVQGQAFNVGRQGENYRIRDVGALVEECVPRSRVVYAPGAAPDTRNYRVDFSKLEDTFPDLKLRWTVREGVEELAAAYARYGLTYDDFTSSRFVRLRRIRELLAEGAVDEMLRRTAGPAEAAGGGAPQAG
jgi:nucleoside-diphosphate-sugar epimerase